MSTPAATASSVRRCFSSSDPSNQSSRCLFFVRALPEESVGCVILVWAWLYLHPPQSASENIWETTLPLEWRGARFRRRMRSADEGSRLSGPRPPCSRFRLRLLGSVGAAPHGRRSGAAAARRRQAGEGRRRRL